MKKIRSCIFALLAILLSVSSVKASPGDSLHVKHYSISLDSLDYTFHKIFGRTVLTVQSMKNGVNTLTLSLQKLSIDSITCGGQKLSYSYDDTTLAIRSPKILNSNDTLDVVVVYHGIPHTDPRFGGFTFSGNYAFNIGVGFVANPHNQGKVWFPCIDTFTDRATYEFHITAPAGYKALCNGLLESVTANPGGSSTYNWRIRETLPTYLAGVAVAPFYTIHRSYNSIPVEINVMPADTVATKKTFAKIDTAISAFIKSYGPYPWEKIGYVAVPFNGGAMEHATSIHVGKVFIDGSLTYETLWAHELSHMWWGDKVTCKTAGDMWLNEGFATFNEARFTEAAYGSIAYKNWIRSNHRLVLQSAHLDDAGYLALVNVPHDYTYGTTVYKKGADVAHTIRGLLGDVSFFKACKDYMNAHAYGNASSADFRDALAASSGVDLTAFFNDWVFTPGFPHFSIDSSLVVQNGGTYQVTLHTRQKQKGNTHIYTMPMEFDFTDGIHDTTLVLTLDSATNMRKVTLSFRPSWISIDRKEKISDAITDYEKTITATGVQSFPETGVSLNVQSIGTPGPVVRIEHNWVAPDPFKQTPPNARLSTYHYWTVDGLFDNTFASRATFSYNGSTSTQTGMIDNTLIIAKEDSLVLYYRPGPAYDWSLARGQKLNKGVPSDKIGTITLDSLRKGQYALGIGNLIVTGISGNSVKTEEYYLQLLPNPCTDVCTVSIHVAGNEKGELKITDVQGKVVFRQLVSASGNVSWNRGEHTGIYFVTLEVNGAAVESQKLILSE